MKGVQNQREQQDEVDPQAGARRLVGLRIGH
jgi:hypothetical protein